MDLLDQIEQYIFQLFKDSLSPTFVYHNFSHTQMMVTAVKEMIAEENLTDIERNSMLVAAWFHDSGYIFGCDNHEEKSKEIVCKYLSDNQITDLDKPLIVDLIEVTKLKSVPKTNLEKIFKDADFYHLASPEYQNYCSLLKKEFTLNSQNCQTDENWCKSNIEFFSKHHRYYSDYAKKNWQPLKDKNFYGLMKQLTNLEEKEKEKKEKNPLNQEIKKKKLAKLERPDRGVDTLFRITLKNHMQLSAIADSKANILLSVNSIIISIVLTVIVPKLDSPSNSHLITPTIILLLTGLLTVTFTILSTKPKISSNQVSEDLVNFKTTNLLFFGNFKNLSLETYTDALNELMQQRDSLYDSLIKDLYYLGKVLDRKYKLLSVSYIIFLVGIIVSVLSFIFAFKNL